MGGNFPAIYDANAITALNDANGNQASMYVNYVKVYQKGNGADESLTTLADGDPQPDEDSVADITTANLLSFDGMTVATDAEASIAVYNLSGALVRTTVGTEMNVADLAGGVYIVKAVAGNREATKKIVIR